MPTIVIKVRGNPRKKLAKLRQMLRSGGVAQRALLFAIGRAVLEKVHESFVVKSLGGTDESGLKWQPLAESTVAKKKELKKRKPSISLDVLTETELLMRSLTPPPKTARGPTRRKDQMFRIERNSVVIGTDRPWAYTHHYGIPGRLPRRPLWPDPANWPPSWWKEICKAAKMELVATITRLLRD